MRIYKFHNTKYLILEEKNKYQERK